MEIWKDIKGWEGKYSISNHGRLKSVGGKFTKKCPDGYITMGCKDACGYRTITLRRPNEIAKFRLHTLVGEAFVDKPASKKKLCVNHIDGDKLNNNDWNLEWISIGENVRHAFRTGLIDHRGEKHPCSKLTKEKVLKMRELRKTGMKYKAIAELFGVCTRQAGDVINGVNWGWL